MDRQQVAGGRSSFHVLQPAGDRINLLFSQPAAAPAGAGCARTADAAVPVLSGNRGAIGPEVQVLLQRIAGGAAGGALMAARESAPVRFLPSHPYPAPGSKQERKIIQ